MEWGKVVDWLISLIVTHPMNASIHIFLIFILYLLSGCCYPKVQLTRSERKLIAYDKQRRPIIFCSESGTCDTVYFHSMFTRSGFNSNFDQWWEMHIGTIKKGSPRGFFYSVYGTSNFPANHY